MELEEKNFRVNSSGWKKIIVDGVKPVNPDADINCLINPEGDIWQIIGGKADGEQLFTWNAAIRETTKVGKRMPTIEEWEYLVKSKNDIPNHVLAGSMSVHFRPGIIKGVSFYCHFCGQGEYADFHSSTEWSENGAYSFSAYGQGYTQTNDKDYGYSVRCIKKLKNRN